MGADDVWATTTPREPPGADSDAGDALRSVATALDVLECFAVDGELGVSDIARRLGIAKSTAHRLLTTLCSRGLTERVPESGRYRLGLHLLELGQLVQARNALRHAAMPVLEHLVHVTGHTANLSIPDGPDVVFVERLESGPVRSHLEHAGRRFPAHCTSSGKAMAAFNPALDRARREAGFPPRVSRTVRSVKDWERELQLVRSRGFATAESEAFDGTSSVAVPILDLSRTAVAAVSLLGPTSRIRPELPRLAELLRVESRRITRGIA